MTSVHFIMLGIAVLLGVIGVVSANMAGREKKSSE
jgi:Flp pilus assembly protein CpaB